MFLLKYTNSKNKKDLKNIKTSIYFDLQKYFKHKLYLAIDRKVLIMM